MFKVHWFVAGCLCVSNEKGPWTIILHAQNQFFMIIAHSVALAKYIEHIFCFHCMIVRLTDCMLGPKHTNLVLVIMMIQHQIYCLCFHHYKKQSSDHSLDWWMQKKVEYNQLCLCLNCFAFIFTLDEVRIIHSDDKCETISMQKHFVAWGKSWNLKWTNMKNANKKKTQALVRNAH